MKIQCSSCSSISEAPDSYLGKEVKCPSCNTSFLVEHEYIPTKEKKLRNGISASIAVLAVVSILLGFVLYDQRIEKIEKQRQVAVERHVKEETDKWVASNWSSNDYFDPVYLSVTRSYKHLEFLIERADSYTNFEVNAVFSGVGDSIERCHQNAVDYLNRMKSSLSEEQLKKMGSIVSNLKDAQINFQKAKRSSGRDFGVHFGRMKSDFKYATGVVEDFNEELNTPPKPSQELIESWRVEAIKEFDADK